MSEEEETLTKAELLKLSREELDLLAKEDGLEPADYSSKKKLVAAILGEDAPAEKPKGLPKTTHKGRFKVLSQIKFADPVTGKPRLQLPYTIIAGDPEKGTKPKKVQAYLQCPAEISSKQVADFFAKGCLAPDFE